MLACSLDERGRVNVHVVYLAPQAKVEKAKAEKLAEKEANKGLIKSLKHEEVDPTDAEKAEATRSLPSREYDKVVDGDGNVHYKRRDTMTPQKEEPGAEETKDAAPEMSPEPEPLKDHNDNEETKDEAKAKVKKPPAEEGYVLLMYRMRYISKIQVEVQK